jgi:hypothetical protein
MVLAAVRDREISTGKAAEMLMIEENTFASRFGEYVEALEE